MSYHLLTKTYFWKKTHDLVDLISFKDSNKVAIQIKTIEKYINPTILRFECYVQIVVSYSLHFLAKYAEQNVFIRLLIIIDKISYI